MKMMQGNEKVRSSELPGTPEKFEGKTTKEIMSSLEKVKSLVLEDR